MVTRDAQITTDVTPVSVILDHVVSKVVTNDQYLVMEHATDPCSKTAESVVRTREKDNSLDLDSPRDTDAESEDDQLAIDLQNTSAQQEEGDYMFTNVYYDHEGHKIKSFSYRYRSSVMSHTAMREGQWYKYKPVGQTWIFEDPKVDDTYGAWIVERVSDDDDTDSYVSDTEMVKSAYNVCPSDELEEASSSDEGDTKGYRLRNGNWCHIHISRCPMPVQTFASNRDFWDCKDVNPATLKDMKSIRDKESYDLFLVKHSTEIEKCSHLKSFFVIYMQIPEDCKEESEARRFRHYF
eukprot:Em0018g802a